MQQVKDNFEKGNISWLFTKEYYNNIPLVEGLNRPVMDFGYVPLLHIKKEDRTPQQKTDLKNFQAGNAKGLEQKTKWLYQKKWSNYNSYAKLLTENARFLAKNSFAATVQNPGLLFGSGITHESGSEGEVKIGFYFDHATGLVVIPGHSIKGLIRSRFPGLIKDPKIKERNYCEIHCLLNDKDYDEHVFENMKKEDADAAKKIIEELENEMFEGIASSGERLSLYREDIFYSAFVIESRHSNDLFLGKDSITPHGDDPLKNPVPLPFIKLLTNTVMQFNFHFPGDVIKAKKKLELIKKIITKYGTGAKTNVGYGQVIINNN